MSDDGYEAVIEQTDNGKLVATLTTPYMSMRLEFDPERIGDILGRRFEGIEAALLRRKNINDHTLSNARREIIVSAVVRYFNETPAACLQALIALESKALVDAIPDHNDRAAAIKFKVSKTAALDMINRKHHRYDKQRRGISPGRTRGSQKSSVKRAKEKAALEVQIEKALRDLWTDREPSKTSVAKKLKIGGISLQTGEDSSLNAFNVTLNRRGVNYREIVERVKDSPNVQQKMRRNKLL
jgi:hypothetical protein